MAEVLDLKEKKHLLIGCTGSVASIKIPKLIEDLKHELPQIEIQLVPTEKSKNFFDTNLPVNVWTDEEEWSQWQKRDDPVIHIELRKWADVLLIAPLDANTMAKIVNGLCDNLLTCVVRAWDFKKPLLFAPAMNTYMWEHPITGEQIQAMKKLGFHEIPCIEKKLMCGDVGYGAMAEVQTIVTKVKEVIENLSGKT